MYLIKHHLRIKNLIFTARASMRYVARYGSPLYIFFSSYCKEEAQSGAFALQFITGFQPHSF